MTFTLSLLQIFGSALSLWASEPISPLPLPKEVSLGKVELGRRLFHDPRLSANNSISCASCHELTSGGDDGKKNSVGINGGTGDINAPTVYNSGLNFHQFWNGRARSLEEQIDGPIQHPKEMGSTWAQIVAKLKSDSEYQNSFKKIYGSDLSADRIKDAIATFERALITPNSRFDRYLRGDLTALNEREKLGYQKFKAFGCIACHQGTNIGGNMFQSMGVMGNYFKDRGTPIAEADLGRFMVTKKESDKYVFRVPSLRNIDLTAPYFHDGSAQTLEQAVTVMAKYQLGLKLSQPDVDLIVAFLKTLTGELPKVAGGP